MEAWFRPSAGDVIVIGTCIWSAAPNDFFTSTFCSTLFGNRFSAMVQTFGQLAISAIAQVLLQTTTAAQIPLYPESHTEGYKFDALLYAVPLTFHLYFLYLLK